ncbi:MAG: LPXTG cell wall anchor domain-containing protein [Collinsella bouchesdurhonensis]|nr:LPXTG cell wall anchor domain-containing protein [Collinsella bouchesdurhonensis]
MRLSLNRAAKDSAPKAATEDLPAAGDDAAMAIAAISVTGATLIAAGIAATKRRKQ